MAITIEQARKIAGVTSGLPRTGGLEGLIAQLAGGGLSTPPRRAPAQEDDGLPPVGGPGGGPVAPGGGTGEIKGPTFEGQTGDRYVTDINGAIERVNSGTYTGADIVALKDAGLITASDAADLLYGVSSGGGSGGAGDPYAGSREARAQAGFASDEQQRAINNAFSFQDLLNSQKYADRNYALDVETSDRNELGNRAGTGLSLAGILDSLMRDERSLYADPANFPELAAAYAGRESDAPIALTQLLGEGFRVNAPAVESRRSALDAVLEQLGTYSGAMNTDASGIRRIYDENPNAEEDFAAMQRYEDAKPKMLASGGSLLTGGISGLGGLKLPDRTPGPVSINDLSTQEPLAIAGEAGPERIDVTPEGREYTPSQATGQALLKILSPIRETPRSVLASLQAGNLPGPNMLPDAFLRRLKPSVRGLVSALLMSGLGRSGLEDFEFERQSYAPAGGVSGYGQVRR